MTENSIFVGDIGELITESSLRHYFSQFGTVLDVNILKSKLTRQRLGYAFVSLSSPDEVALALGSDESRVVVIDRREVRLKRAKRNTSLLVHNISSSTTKETLDELFGDCGVISNSVLRSKKNDRVYKVTLKDRKAAELCYSRFSEYNLEGNLLHIEWCKNEAEKLNKKAINATDAPTVSLYVTFATVDHHAVVTEPLLYKVFSCYGKITKIAIKRNEYLPSSQTYSGYAFVHFESTLEGVSVCEQVASEMADTVKVGVRYRAELSRKFYDTKRALEKSRSRTLTVPPLPTTPTETGGGYGHGGGYGPGAVGDYSYNDGAMPPPPPGPYMSRGGYYYGYPVYY